MDKIPFKEQCVIDELVELWLTHYVPQDLATHITGLGPWESTYFFQQVYADLSTDKHSEYAAFSASEFKRFLETVFRRLDQGYTKTPVWAQAETFAERQARVRAKTQAETEAKARVNALRQNRTKLSFERQAKARADFDALGKEMAKATTRAERVELGRKRADLAPHTGLPHTYENHCWMCHARISSDIHAQCPGCTYYICSSCGSCLC